MRPPIKRELVDRIYELCARETRTGIESIRASLAPIDGKLPAARTIARYRQTFRELPEQEKLLYAEFAWPESMEAGALPWEASRAAMDLLVFLGAEFTPTNRDVLWFWRLTLAAPDMPIKERAAMAETLTYHRDDLTAVADIEFALRIPVMSFAMSKK